MRENNTTVNTNGQINNISADDLAAASVALLDLADAAAMETNVATAASNQANNNAHNHEQEKTNVKKRKRLESKKNDSLFESKSESSSATVIPSDDSLSSDECRKPEAKKTKIGMTEHEKNIEAILLEGSTKLRDRIDALKKLSNYEENKSKIDENSTAAQAVQSLFSKRIISKRKGFFVLDADQSVNVDLDSSDPIVAKVAIARCSFENRSYNITEYAFYVVYYLSLYKPADNSILEQVQNKQEKAGAATSSTFSELLGLGLTRSQLKQLSGLNKTSEKQPPVKVNKKNSNKNNMDVVMVEKENFVMPARVDIYKKLTEFPFFNTNSAQPLNDVTQAVVNNANNNNIDVAEEEQSCVTVFEKHDINFILN